MERQLDWSGTACGRTRDFLPRGMRGALIGLGLVLVMSGAALAQPQLNVSPPGVEFGTVPVGETSSAQTVTISSSGDQVVGVYGVSITGTNKSDFAIASDSGGAGLAPGARRFLRISFTPSAGGPRNANLTITSNAAGSPQNVPLTGTGGGGAGTSGSVQLSTTSLTFPAQLVGTASQARSVTVTNSSSEVVTITAVNLAGTNPESFTIVSTSPTAVLNPGDTFVVQVAFRPAIELAQSATLLISTSVSAGPLSVALSGAGTASVPSGSLLIVPGRIDFGGQPVATKSRVQTFAVTNNGDDVVIIFGISLGGDNPGDFSALLNCPGDAIILNPGDSCYGSVSLTPTDAGPRAALLSVSSSAPGSPTVLTLSGNGTRAAAGQTGEQPGGQFGPNVVGTLSVTPGILSFGDRERGATGTVRSLTLTNVGRGPVTILGVSLVTDDAPEFQAFLNCSSPTLLPGQSCFGSALFRPRNLGGRAAFLTIRTNTPESPIVVPMFGNGVP